MIAPSRVRALRPAVPAAAEPRHPRTLDERERLPDGRVVASRTVFPVGAECPFACVHCDLWRHTIGPRATAPGSLPRQIREGLAGGHGIEQVKVYNASNFFDERAVPAADDAALVEILAPFSRLVVECHPRWIGGRCFELAERLPGRLQVAIGLETVHPTALPRLGKAMTVERFDRAVDALLTRDIGVRAFVLLGAPFVPPDEGVEWAVLSVEHALRRGVEHVAILPLRGGNGAIDELRRRGELGVPTLTDLEEAFDRSLEVARAGVVTADLWDLEDDLACSACREARRGRLARMNLSACVETRVACPAGCEAT